MPRAKATASSPFVFATTTSSAKLDPVTRKQIRSHVMRGKNRRQRGSHPSVTPGLWINGNQEPRQSVELWRSPRIPPRVGNDLSHLQFADKMEPYMQELIFLWFTVLKKSMYPVEPYVQSRDEQWLEYLAVDRAFLHSMLSAALAYLDYARKATVGEKALYHLKESLHTLNQNLDDRHLATSDSTISTVLALTMLSHALDEMNTAQKHMEGLKLLVTLRGGISRLQNNAELQVKVLRADLGIAIATGSKPYFFADGLSFDRFLTPPDNNNNNNNTAANTPMRKCRTKTAGRAIVRLLPDITEPRLLAIALDLQEFSFAANVAVQTGRKIRADLFRETLLSAQYRLLALQREHDHRDQLWRDRLRQHAQWCGPQQQQHQADEDGVGLFLAEQRMSMITWWEEAPAPESVLLRLGMLVFTTTTFLHIREMPMRHADLARRVRKCVRTMAEEDAEGLSFDEQSVELRRLQLWFLFMARVSVPAGADDEEVLVGTTRRLMRSLGLAGAGWDEVRSVLRAFMWIDCVHSGMGEAFLGTVYAGWEVAGT